MSDAGELAAIRKRLKRWNERDTEATLGDTLGMIATFALDAAEDIEWLLAKIDDQLAENVYVTP